MTTIIRSIGILVMRRVSLMDKRSISMRTVLRNIGMIVVAMVMVTVGVRVVTRNIVVVTMGVRVVVRSIMVVVVAVAVASTSVAVTMSMKLMERVNAMDEGWVSMMMVGERMYRVKRACFCFWF
ncbi:hypothetical protein Adt_47415 [Abeliophyllum distichum]|uniref:Uncharacterized protein n=1 Tax=Abeliophyllum distichum TaxID=126358 RepID=A0ABD1NX52_9LAMI